MSALTRIEFASLLVFTCMIGNGCTPNAFDGPLGPPDGSPLLSPFAGKWVFDFDKTLAAQEAAGVSEEQIAELRKLFADNPILGKMHEDLMIKGNVVFGVGTPSSEYRLFAVHEHGSKVCGKAWHHEDRFDPGDMSKCYVRFSIVDGDLHLEVNMLDEPLDVNDPDLLSTPVEADLSNCDADKHDSDDWATYVFTPGA